MRWNTLHQPCMHANSNQAPRGTTREDLEWDGEGVERPGDGAGKIEGVSETSTFVGKVIRLLQIKRNIIQYIQDDKFKRCGFTE